MCFFLGPSPFSVTFLFVLLTLGKSFQVPGSKVLSFLLLPGAPSVSRDVPSSGLCATSATLSDLDRNITRLHAVNFLFTGEKLQFTTDNITIRNINNYNMSISQLQ